MERKLTMEEKEEVYNVFLRLGKRMELKALPANYIDWLKIRDEHLLHDLEKSAHTIDLYTQYKKHLGAVRYKILLQAQILVAPKRVNELLWLGKTSWLTPLLGAYKVSRRIKVDRLIKSIILPANYKEEIKALDVVPQKNLA